MSDNLVLAWGTYKKDRGLLIIPFGVTTEVLVHGAS